MKPNTTFAGPSPFGPYTPPPPKLDKLGRPHSGGNKHKLSMRQIYQARLDREQGVPVKNLARYYAVSTETMRDAIKGVGPYRDFQ